MIYSILQIVHNGLFLAAAVAWLIAQVMKIAIASVKRGGFSRDLLTSSGGFPSSHSATVAGLTAMAVKLYGWDSEIFAVCFFLSMIVMYDALGVRAETGKQSAVLNRLWREHPELFAEKSLEKETDATAEAGGEPQAEPPEELYEDPEIEAEIREIPAESRRLSRSERHMEEERKEKEKERASRELKREKRESRHEPETGDRPEDLFPLNENTGHTLPELIAGLAIGVIVAIIMPVF